MKFSSFAAALALAASTSVAALPHASSNLDRRDATSHEIPGFFSKTCTSEKMTIRKEWRHLTKKQQDSFLDSVQCLMDKPAESGLTATTSRFSDLQALHRGMTNTAYADIIHHVGQFLPWHRYYMHIYETLLRDECGYSGPIPWWDEQKDADSGKMWQSSMWGADAFGGNGTGSDLCVRDGRFSNYTLHIGPGDEDTDYCLRRAWDTENAIANANSTALDMCNAYNTYAPWWDCISNIPHKGVHTYIGGVMADIKSSPGDPIFFMHHMYIDRVWWLWQKQDPINRLYDISGPTVNHTANVEPAGGWQNATLHYELSSFNIMANTTIGHVMNTQGGYLCYGYD
ncbi:tyrosinase [Aspergillus sclerotiicarbonarius CBS 121057]|uniref:Tyrosinase n=1 Tax=Aspergillus sclerotiicarbonarius (strain CBS 121057 / IBT 28362) TaxID=1448318 RepID=A0A319DU42_ASPSB|nr:tyrosinase [Aspergillus sclerotiicarbonarius CBS 121057]